MSEDIPTHVPICWTTDLLSVFDDMTTLCKMFCPDDLEAAMARLQPMSPSGIASDALPSVVETAG